MFLLDAGLTIGYMFSYSLDRCGLVSLLDEDKSLDFLSDSPWLLWPCVPVGRQLAHWMLFFPITLVVVALCSCWMPAWSLDTFSLNHIGCCGLVSLLDETLVIGYIFS